MFCDPYILIFSTRGEVMVGLFALVIEFFDGVMRSRRLLDDFRALRIPFRIPFGHFFAVSNKNS